jgi:Alw26I/Eco31I/Esp3I family type II restriction endonuclease
MGRTNSPSQEYVAYQIALLESPPFNTFPTDRDDDGNLVMTRNGFPRWQVSISATPARHATWKSWWNSQMSSIGITPPYDGKYGDAARALHPTGDKPCYICGNSFRVGHWYTNSITARLFLGENLEPPAFGTPIDECLEDMVSEVGNIRAVELLSDWFPERANAFAQHGATAEAFEATLNIVPTKKRLSPGFMTNSPDRLDGFHDYAGPCLDRVRYDKGRSPSNMRTYAHDRRAFKWWAEGEWAAADTLYGLAGMGACQNVGCSTEGEILISPDHIGPLSCGFRHIPHFGPMCMACNSAKNKRMRLIDIQQLIQLENEGTTVAGWQIHNHWNQHKNLVTSNEMASTLSRSLRSLQDMYLRVLHRIWTAGHTRFLVGLIRSEYALIEYEFTDLNSGALAYTSINRTQTNRKNRWSRMGRDVCIAFEELQQYVSKSAANRNLMRKDYDINEEKIDGLLESIDELLHHDEHDVQWSESVDLSIERQIRKLRIMQLFGYNDADDERNFVSPQRESDAEVRELIGQFFDDVGSSTMAFETN